MNKIFKQERGITLIALIITIIILVILAAVSIRAVANMGIVQHAVNGTQDYAQKAKEENEMLENTETKIKDALDKLSEIQGGTTSGSTTGNTNPNYSVAVTDSDITDPTIFIAEPINTETGALSLAALPTKKAKITGIKSEYFSKDFRYTNGAAGTYDYWGVKVNNQFLDTLVIPDVITINNVEYTVTEVDFATTYMDGEEEKTFYHWPSIKTIIFPNTVTKIGGDNFDEHSDTYPLENVVFPSGLTTIGTGTFECTNLKNIVISTTGNLTIGDRAFANIPNLSTFTLSVGGTLDANYNILTDGSGHYTEGFELRIDGDYTTDETKYHDFIESVTNGISCVRKVVWTNGSTNTSVWYTSYDNTDSTDSNE